MILVDASVLIDFLRTKDAKLDGLFRSLPVAVCGATRAEILAGVRSISQRRKLLAFLGTFRQVVMPRVCWDILGDNLALLRTHGVTVPFPPG